MTLTDHNCKLTFILEKTKINVRSVLENEKLAYD